MADNPFFLFFLFYSGVFFDDDDSFRGDGSIRGERDLYLGFDDSMMTQCSDLSGDFRRVGPASIEWRCWN